MKKSLLFFIACAFMAVNSYSQWNLTGNSNATSTSVLGTTNAIPLSLVTKNTKRLVIDTLGRVGIGIASPINILTVKGAGSTPAASWVSSGSPLFVGFGETTPGNADFNLALASATVNARGVIGLKRSRGTLAVPAAVVANDQLGSVLVSGFDGANFQGSAAVDFFADGAPTVGNVPARISFVTGSNSSNRAERLKIASNGDIFINNTQLTVTNATGNVGVGTNTFLNGEKFAIKQNGLQLGVYPGYLDNVANSGYTTLEMPGVNTLRIWDNLSVSDNVGIGTASPTARLEVTGGDAKMNANLLVAKNANIKGITGINGDTLSGTALYVNAGVAINGIRVKDPVDNYVLYAEKSGENNGVYISSSTTTSGSGAIAGVASGTATGVEAYGSLNNGLYAQSDSAAAVYAVSNSSLGIYAETGDPASYAGYFNGDVFSVGIFSSSDARLKNNIKDFGNAMQLIGTLKPKNYDYKRDGDYASLNLPHGNHYGLIAQDLEKVLPNLVKETSINIKNHKKVGVGIEKGLIKGI